VAERVKKYATVGGKHTAAGEKHTANGVNTLCIEDFCWVFSGFLGIFTHMRRFLVDIRSYLVCKNYCIGYYFNKSIFLRFSHSLKIILLFFLIGAQFNSYFY